MDAVAQYLQRKQIWEQTQTGPFVEPPPLQMSNATAAKLWIEKRKFVRVRGKSRVVDASSIVLNAPKPSIERPALANWGHIMVAAVTCRAIQAGDVRAWIKSDVAKIDQVFSLGPSLTINVSMLGEPQALVRYSKGASMQQQLTHSRPLIDVLIREIEGALGISNRKVGAIDRIDAVHIDIAKAEVPRASRRAGYKTALVSKPGMMPEEPPDSTPGTDPEQGSASGQQAYDVNMTISVLCVSIEEVSRFNRKLSSLKRRLGGRSFQTQAQVPGGTQVGAGGTCRSHYECTRTGLFCSVRGKCEACRYCSIDAVDSIDGVCPQELCPLSGGFPECVDATKLVENVQSCKAQYPFAVWRYTDDHQKRPQVKPRPKPKLRYVTPYNRLVGAVTITQRRRKQVECVVANKLVQVFVNTSGGVCQSTQEMDAQPYGLDPMFQRFSSVYDGKLEVDKSYFVAERRPDNSPIAFFPHQHDPLANSSAVSKRRHAMGTRDLTILNPLVTALVKEDSKIHGPSRDLFKVYFDESLNGAQTDKMLSWLKDANFLDGKTEQVDVQIVTYNAEQDLFVICSFTFYWQTSGKIRWGCGIDTSVDAIVSLYACFECRQVLCSGI
jgi:hypothetical protein